LLRLSWISVSQHAALLRIVDGVRSTTRAPKASRFYRVMK